MATFVQLQDRTYAILRDPGQTFVLLTEVKDWINEAQLEIATRLRCIEHELSDTFADATGVEPVPADFLDILGFRIGTADVTFVDSQSFWEAQDEGLTLEEPAPYIGRIFDGAFEIYPAPASGTAYKLRYVRTPATLSADNDVPEIPTEWHVHLSLYATARALYKMNEEGHGDKYMAMYLEGLPPMRSPRSRNRPGKRAIVVEPNAFDYDPEAMHLGS